MKIYRDDITYSFPKHACIHVVGVHTIIIFISVVCAPHITRSFVVCVCFFKKKSALAFVAGCGGTRCGGTRYVWWYTVHGVVVHGVCGGTRCGGTLYTVGMAALNMGRPYT